MQSFCIIMVALLGIVRDAAPVRHARTVVGNWREPFGSTIIAPNSNEEETTRKEPPRKSTISSLSSRPTASILYVYEDD